MQANRTPDFIIAGAPKCGTTAMHTWLSRHPDLCMLPKELHYWGSDLSYQNPRITTEAYLDHFPTDQKTTGEVAVWYMMSEKAAEEIYAANPNVKIIFMLRDPVEAVPSLHQQMVYTGNEPLEDLKDALDAEASRITGNELPDHFYCPAKGLCYTHVYRYEAQVARYKALFPEHQLHFITFDAFKSNTAEVFQNLLKFIGVDDSFTTDFDVVNAAQVTKNQKVQNMILTPGKGLKKVVKTVIPSKNIREKIKARVWEANSKEEKRAPLSPELKEKLEKQFAKERKWLNDLPNQIR